MGEFVCQIAIGDDIKDNINSYDIYGRTYINSNGLGDA